MTCLMLACRAFQEVIETSNFIKTVLQAAAAGRADQANRVRLKRFVEAVEYIDIGGTITLFCESVLAQVWQASRITA